MDDRILARALAALADHAVETDNGTRVILHAARFLAARNIPQDALDELEKRGCVASYGEHRIRIVHIALPTLTPIPEPLPTTALPAPTAVLDVGADAMPAHARTPHTNPVMRAPDASHRPTYALLMDLANSQRTHGEFGIRFRLGVIRDRAREMGVIAFACVLGDAKTMDDRLEDDCYIAGFTIVHCVHIVNRDVRKDTADPQIADLAARFVALPGVDGVLVVGDDTDFLAVHHRIRDTGKRCTFLAIRDTGRLAAGADVLPLYPTRFHWTPDIALDLLRAMPTSAGAGREQMFQRFADEAPLPARVLRTMLRIPALAEGGAPVDTRAIVEKVWDTLDPLERRHIGMRDLMWFIRACTNTMLFTRSRVTTADGDRIQYRIRWDHPFAAAFLASRKNGNGHAPIATIEPEEEDLDAILDEDAESL